MDPIHQSHKPEDRKSQISHSQSSGVLADNQTALGIEACWNISPVI